METVSGSKVSKIVTNSASLAVTQPQSAAIPNGDGTTAVALLVAVACWAIFVVWHSTGSLEYDDTFYLTRGIFHAHQVEGRSWPWARLIYSLSFEGYRPPLYHGWVAIGAMTLGDGSLPGLMRWATIGPFLLLLSATIAGGWMAGKAVGTTFAAAFLVSSNVVLPLASKTFVDTAFAGWICAFVVTVAALCMNPRAIWVCIAGAVGGFAALTKLTVVLFAGPVLVVALFALSSQCGWMKALRMVAGVVLIAALVAAPWYLWHGVDSVHYARYAATFWPCADVESPWTRPVRLVEALVGWPVSILAVVGLAVSRKHGQSGNSASIPLWGWLATAATLPAAVAVMLPPVFEPRYLVAALGPTAIWFGGRISLNWLNWSSLQKSVTIAAGFLITAWAGYQALSAPVIPMPGGLENLLRYVAGERNASLRVCQVGSRPEWNVEKVRLAVEEGRLRQRIEVADSLREWNGADTGGRFDQCDLVFLLGPVGEFAPVSQHRLNEGLTEASKQLHEYSAFHNCRECASRLTTNAPVAVYLRNGINSIPPTNPAP